jgi:hypothetical protein
VRLREHGGCVSRPLRDAILQRDRRLLILAARGGGDLLPALAQMSRQSGEGEQSTRELPRVLEPLLLEHATQLARGVMRSPDGVDAASLVARQCAIWKYDSSSRTMTDLS